MKFTKDFLVSLGVFLFLGGANCPGRGPTNYSCTLPSKLICFEYSKFRAVQYEPAFTSERAECAGVSGDWERGHCAQDDRFGVCTRNAVDPIDETENYSGAYTLFYSQPSEADIAANCPKGDYQAK